MVCSGTNGRLGTPSARIRVWFSRQLVRRELTTAGALIAKTLRERLAGALVLRDIGWPSTARLWISIRDPTARERNSARRVRKQAHRHGTRSVVSELSSPARGRKARTQGRSGGNGPGASVWARNVLWRAPGPQTAA
jgi:hypothetical protein